MKKKNIVIILSDQMQQKTVMDESKAIMPNLRNLQKNAVTFCNAHSVNAICSPSRASMLTGLLPHNHGMVDCTHTVPAYRSEYDYSLHTLTNELHDAGYVLAHYGKWHIERSYDLHKFGFSAYETERQIPKKQVHYLDKVTIHNEGYRDYTLCGIYQEGPESSEEHYMVSKAIDFVEAQKEGDNPFCLVVSAYAPHDPYMVPRCIYDLYDNHDITIPGTWEKDGQRPVIYDRLHEVWKSLSPSDILKAIRCYYSYCSLVDEEMGRLIDCLKQNDLYDDTLILFLADHGDLVGSHGLFCKGVPSYEEGYSIPLVVKFPEGKGKGLECKAYASSCDILPTILDVEGLGWRGGKLDGMSLVPFVDNPEMCDDSYSIAEFHGQRYSYTQRIIWHKQLKYVFNAFDRDCLYDLCNDPEEKYNLIDDPAFEEQKKTLVSLLWKKIVESGDWSMQDAQYCMHRLLPVGPGEVPMGDNFKRFNLGF
ncbi:MAG: sulfatase-like hydrolase/transferase [Sphaerochaetaceae bacterium]|nr:sulfatase-like hydrolase/transferase [Spirochaetales bacterium]MDY5499401.1 sulfatase-like hydrolase/transferase [Sphaerochaetaceae bacterium]